MAFCLFWLKNDIWLKNDNPISCFSDDSFEPFVWYDYSVLELRCSF